MSPERTLSHAEARRFYDRLGARQDTQQFYEGPALAALRRYADFEAARFVVELGCGTGRFAVELLDEALPPNARYLGLDASGTMVGLARERTARFGERAEVRLTDGSPATGLPDRTADRFVATYVLDLLSEDDVRAVLDEAWRVLGDGGLLAVVGLTPGTTFPSRVVSAVWRGVHRLRPALVGGCRPLRVASFLASERWTLRHREVVTPFALASEVVVAAPVR